MGTTAYFEGELPPLGGDGKPDLSGPTTTFEVVVSSFSGEHRLYLKIVDAKGDELLLSLDKANAVALHEGLERAAFYLRYIE